jgi:hypothetical protein
VIFVQTFQDDLPYTLVVHGISILLGFSKVVDIEVNT